MSEEVGAVEARGSLGSSAPPQISEGANDNKKGNGDEEKKDGRNAHAEPVSDEKTNMEPKPERSLKDEERREVREIEAAGEPSKQARNNPDAKKPVIEQAKPAPPTDPDGPSRSANADRWSATADRMFGAAQNNGTMNFNIGREAGVVSASFEQDLRIVQTPPTPRAPADPADVDGYMLLLRQRRVLVIAHGRSSEDTAISAMHSLLSGVRESEPTRPQATSGFDKLFPLHSFYERAEWPSWLCGSLVYLNRSADISSAAFFDDVSKVCMLRDQLNKVDAHLLITVNAENRRFIQGSSEVDTWKLLGQVETTASADWSSIYSSPVEKAIAICAALLPGLGTRELIEIVDSLVPLPEPVSATVPSTSGPKGGRPQAGASKAPTRDKRWAAGEHDAVLRELGVVFSTAEERSSERASEAGFIFGDAHQRAAMPGWVLSHFPVLITGHIDTLADRYLTHSSTRRFRVNFLNLLFHLEGFGLFRLTTRWLEQRFQSLFARDRPLECARYFVELLLKAMDSSGGNTLVDELVEGIVTDAIQCERHLLESVPEDLFARAVQAVTLDSEDPTGQFWDVLLGAGASQGVIQAAILRLHVVAETLAELSRHRPVTVSAGIRRLLAPAALEGTRWSRQIVGLESTAPILRISYLSFRAMLEQVLEKDIHLWIAFSQMMLGEDCTSEDSAGPPDAVTLTQDCLNILVRRLSDIDPRALPDPLYEALFAPDRRARTGRLLAGLIGKLEEPDEGRVVWFYRMLTTTLLARNNAAAQDVSVAMQELIFPLRAVLSAARRSAVSRRAHEFQQHYFNRRAYFLAAGAREPLRTERERIEAMHIVIRALSGARSASATTSR
jgi:hypothetical protein